MRRPYVLLRMCLCLCDQSVCVSVFACLYACVRLHHLAQTIAVCVNLQIRQTTVI